MRSFAKWQELLVSFFSTMLLVFFLEIKNFNSFFSKIPETELTETLDSGPSKCAVKIPMMCFPDKQVL